MARTKASNAQLLLIKHLLKENPCTTLARLTQLLTELDPNREAKRQVSIRKA